MSKYFIGSLLIMVVLISCKQEIEKPKLFSHNHHIDIGKINFDSTYLINFKIFNKGNAILIVDTITASCGCTIPTLAKKNIEPEDSAIIVATYKPVDTGLFDKKLIVKSNTDSSFTVLSFHGQAIKY